MGSLVRGGNRALPLRPGRASGPTGAEQREDDELMTGLDAYVQRIVDAAPPLTQAQKDRLAVLLNAGTTSTQLPSRNDTESARRA